MLSVSQKPNHADFGVCLYAGTRRLPHQNRCKLDSGSLASTAYHRYHRCCYHHSLPHLEAQTQ